MNFKLKGIELEAFRIYEDRQLFNFLTPSGEVANLIVIYAPNGYGKTSFIDAVEWVLTGKIDRISKNSIIKNTADSEKGEILKNKKSPKEFGSVTLIAENGGYLTKNTKVIGKNNRKTDYVEGDITAKAEIFNELLSSDFSTRSILGQDKIDSFLRSSSPKDRYDTLTNFWDDANDSELFKKIVGMTSESDKQLEKVKEQILHIEKEIQSLIIRPNMVIEINSLVEEFNQLKLRDINLIELEQGSSQQFIKLLIELFTKVQTSGKENLDKINNSRYLVENYKFYYLKNDELKTIEKNIKTNTEILNKFKTKEEQTNALNLVTAEALNIYFKYKKLKDLKEKHNKSERISVKIENYEKLNRILVKDLSNLKDKKIKEEQNLEELKSKLNNVEKIKGEIERNYSELDKNIEEYRSLASKKTYLLKRSSKIENLINIRLKNKEAYAKELLTLESYSKYEIQNIIKIESDNQLIRDKVRELIYRYHIKTQAEQKLKELNLEYTQFGKLADQLNVIYKAGKKFIEASQSNSCPLCKQEYEDFNSLIKNVDRDFLEVETLNKIKLELEDRKKVLENEEKQIQQSIIEFKAEIDIEITRIYKKAVLNEAKITSYDTLSQRNKIKLEDLKRTEESLLNFFKQLSIDAKNSNFVNLREIKASIEEERNTLINSSSGYSREIIDKQELQIKLAENLKEIEVDIGHNKNKIRELREEPILKRVIQLLEELNIENNVNKIDSEIKGVKHKFSVQLYKKRLITEQINLLNKDLSIINKQEILNSLEKNQKDYQDVQRYINSYKEKLNEFIFRDSSLEDDLKQIHSDLEDEKNRVKKGLDALNQLMGFTKYIEDNIASKTKDSKKEEYEKELAVLEKGNIELLSAKKYVTDYIDNKIKNAFNLESINSIYQRIDPHPDFNNVKFDIDLNKEKPELHIYASNKHEKLAPILYFSAAQINILSLSIFLAKALIKEQEGLNTIFMDDPIQHLDNLNILSFIDLLRTITGSLEKQVVISTHNENFYKLIKRKMEPEFTSSKFIELESFGKIKSN